MSGTADQLVKGKQTHLNRVSPEDRINMESVQKRTIFSETFNGNNVVIEATNSVMVGNVKGRVETRNAGKRSAFSSIVLVFYQARSSSISLGN